MDTSGANPVGTPVDFQIGATLSGEVNITGDPLFVPYYSIDDGAEASVSAQFMVTQIDPRTGISTQLGGFNVGDAIGPDCPTRCGINTQTVTVQTFVGATLEVWGYLRAFAHADAMRGGIDNVVATASGSVLFHVDPPPGISYTSASGQTYFSGP